VLISGPPEHDPIDGRGQNDAWNIGRGGANPASRPVVLMGGNSWSALI